MIAPDLVDLALRALSLAAFTASPNRRARAAAAACSLMSDFLDGKRHVSRSAMNLADAVVTDLGPAYPEQFAN